MFYYIISTTYKKIGDLFCPWIFLDFQFAKSARSTQRVENISFSLSHTCYKPLLLLKLAAALQTVHN